MTLQETIRSTKFCPCGQIARKGQRDCPDCHAAYLALWRILRHRNIQVIIYDRPI